jgi:choline-sulfatase
VFTARSRPVRCGWVARAIAAALAHLSLLLAALVLPAGELRARNYPLTVPPRPPVPVILISVDTLRADHLGCYGDTGVKTPSIDVLATGGTLFSQVSSQVPVTLPSHFSLFTSTYPFANGVEENGERVPPGLPTLAEVLGSHGYATAAFIGGYFLAREFGLDRGFSVYDSPFAGHLEGEGVAAALKRPAGDVLADARTWLADHDRASGPPFFLFVHLFDLHRPYTEPEKFRAQYPGSEYDAELVYADGALGDFWRFLQERGLFSRSLIVLTADHGESLGDHGESTHGYFIYQSTLRVPLIIHWPEAQSRGRVVPAPAHVDEPVGLIDLAPTILQFLDLPVPGSFQGISLLPLLGGGASEPVREVYSESPYAHDKFGWSPLRALRAGDFKYIDAPQPELYDLAHDPGEDHNLVASRVAVAAALRDQLGELRKRFASTSGLIQTSVSPDTVRNLHALGYFGFKASYVGHDTSGPDPKDRVGEYREYLRALELSQTGHANEAAATYREILEDDSQNLPAHDDLGDCYLQLRRFFDAAREARAALAIDPRDIQAAELLGSVWLEAGDKAQARAAFEQLLTFAPDDYAAHFGLGLLDQNAGHPDDALRHFQAALRVRPDSADAHDRMGEIYLKQGDYGSAAGEFRRALELNPELSAARDSLRRLGVNAK